MNRILGLASSLNNVLLSTDEDEYDKIACEVVSYLNKASDLVNLSLENFDPSYQTIPFLYILSAHIDASFSNGKAAPRLLPAPVLPQGRLWPAISTFLLTFDPIQVRYVGHLYSRVVEVVVKGAEQSGDAAPTIQLLQNAIIRLDPNSSTLTTTHYHYIRLCLQIKASADAALILDRPIYAISSADTVKQVGNRGYRYLCSVHDSSSTYLNPATRLSEKISSRTYMEYHLMGALCYISLGQFQEASTFLEIVLVSPVVQNATSAIQLEAYKKWVLINLILHGSAVDIPKPVPTIVARNLRTAAKPYEVLAEAFKSDDKDRLLAEIEAGMEYWQADCNYGLVHQICLAFRKFRTIRLEKTYEALPLEDVARVLDKTPSDPRETAQYILGLTQANEVRATLAMSTGPSIGSLAFSTEPKTSEAGIEAQIMTQNQSLQQALRYISEMDHQMEINREYVEWLQKLRAARDREKKSGGAPTGRPLIADAHDEDMMDDL